MQYQHAAVLEVFAGRPNACSKSNLNQYYELFKVPFAAD
jgi:hypothetical protein